MLRLWQSWESTVFSSAVFLCDLEPPSYSPAIVNWLPGVGALAKLALWNQMWRAWGIEIWYRRGEDEAANGQEEQEAHWGWRFQHVCNTKIWLHSLAHKLALVLSPHLVLNMATSASVITPLYPDFLLCWTAAGFSAPLPSTPSSALACSWLLLCWWGRCVAQITELWSLR